MKYVFINGAFRLINYHCSVVDENDTKIEYDAVGEVEKDGFLAMFPNATVEEIDNTGYEWLDGMTFTNEQRSAGEVEKAIEMGEAAYMEYLYASDPDAQMLDLDYRLSLIELGVGGEAL